MSDEANERIRRLIRPAVLASDEPLFWSPGRGNDVWEMICAAISGDLETIRRLLSGDPSLWRCHHNYHTPLSFAVRENQIGVAEFLFDGSRFFGDPLEIARDRGYTAMERMLEAKFASLGVSPGGEAVAAAIRDRDAQKVRALLDASPELLHARDRRTNGPIHWAVMTRQLGLIDELVSRGADVNSRRMDGARPIQLANGDYTYRGWRDVPKDTVTTPREVIAHLRARGARCDICTASYLGDLERVRELLDQDPSLANRPSEYITYYACSGTPLRNAAAGGHLEIVRLLLERGADPNLPEEHIAPRGHALHAAVCNRHVAIVKVLLEKGARPNVEIESSADTLSMAIAAKDQAMIDLLASHGAARALHLLAYSGDVLTAAAVFAANPGRADDPEALANAAGEGHEAFVRLMLRYQPDLPKRVAFAPWTAGAKTRELNELLFKHGMDPSQPDWLRKTPLHRYAEKDGVENAALFIERGADLDARDEEFRSTPLGYAARCGKIRMVELLLDRGARPNLPDDPPWATPLAWARRRGHRDIAELLERRGAR
jgi:ankyrin repeat protein